MAHNDEAVKRSNAFGYQELGRKSRIEGNYKQAANHYRSAAVIWNELGEVELEMKCRDLADDLDAAVTEDAES